MKNSSTLWPICLLSCLPSTFHLLPLNQDQVMWQQGWMDTNNIECHWIWNELKSALWIVYSCETLMFVELLIYFFNATLQNDPPAAPVCVWGHEENTVQWRHKVTVPSQLHTFVITPPQRRTVCDTATVCVYLLSGYSFNIKATHCETGPRHLLLMIRFLRRCPT